MSQASRTRGGLGCAVFGHRPRFEADGQTMTWACERGCGEGGAKVYPTPEDARRFAASFNRRDSSDLGRRAPLVGLFPLRIWYRLRRGRGPREP